MLDPQDAYWSNWETYEALCSSTCGPGVGVRVRNCLYASPGNEETDCTGDFTDVTDCNIADCEGIII